MKRVIAVCTTLVLAVTTVAVLQLASAAPASALSCRGLANKMFSSSNPLYWAKRYYNAGCGG